MLEVFYEPARLASGKWFTVALQIFNPHKDYVLAAAIVSFVGPQFHSGKEH